MRHYSSTLCHYGVGHLHGGHSGRYPWGSGKDGDLKLISHMSKFK